MEISGIATTLRCWAPTLLLASVVLLGANSATAQPHTYEEATGQKVLSVTDPAAIAEWLGRIVGRFKYDGIMTGPCAPPIADGGGPPAPLKGGCESIKGSSDCIHIGEGPGVQCILNVTWIDEYSLGFPEGTARDVGVSYLDPAMELFGLDPGKSAISHMVVNNKGLPEGGLGYIKGNTATFRMRCVNAAGRNVEDCYRVVIIEAKPDAKVLFAWFGFSEKDSGIVDLYATMSMRRIKQDDTQEESGPQR